MQFATVQGEVDSRFEPVREAFAAIMADPEERGASFAVHVDGRRVVRLWAGFADRARTKPWTPDTLANVFSTTKGWTATCVHRLVDQGKLDLDAKVCTYWPELAAGGKEVITLRMLLAHQAGLPALRDMLPPEALFDWRAMIAALEAETPWWEPGTRHGYHAVTFGWLLGEVIRRVSGRMPGDYFREEIAGPLGLDAHVGLAEIEDTRCAELRFRRRDPAAPPTFAERLQADPTSMAARSFSNPISLVMPGTVATRAWRGAQIPSANGHATADAIARLYGALARGGELDGVRVLSPPSVEAARGEQASGDDLVLGVPTRFGAGFMLAPPDATFGAGPGAFGHPGLGGSLGLADPESRLAIGFVTNSLGAEILLDPRAVKLVEAAYRCL